MNTDKQRFLMIVQTHALNIEMQKNQLRAGPCVAAAMRCSFKQHTASDELIHMDDVIAAALGFVGWFYSLKQAEVVYPFLNIHDITFHENFPNDFLKVN